MSDYRPYPKTKPSGVEWLGDVPVGWEVSRLGFETWVRARLGWKGLKAEEYVDEGYAFLATPNIKGENIDFDNVNFISLIRFNESPEIIIREGDVLLAKDGSTLGIVNVVRHLPRPTTVNSSIAVITPNRRLNGIFLYYLFRSSYMEHTIQRIKGGMGVPHLFQADLNKFSMPHPPLPEQHQIATFLDRECGKLDALQAKQQRLIELLKEKRQALISHAVTKGLDPNAKLKNSGIEWLGDVPEHWRVQRLGHFSLVVRGASPRPAGDPQFFDGDFMPWITVAEITKDDRMHLTETSTLLTEDGARSSRVLRYGTLVLTNSGATLGVPKILAVTGCANDGVVAFESLRPDAFKEFLYWYLGTLTEDLRERMKQGSGQPNLNTDIVKAIPVALPPLAEQRAIVAHLDEKCGKIDQLRAKAERGIELLKERRSALISAAVTGKIDVRDM